MQAEIYTLPEINFVGGASQTYYFNLKDATGQIFDATECTINFAIINYNNKNGTPTLSKQAEIIADTDSINSIALIKLLPSDTKSLFGKFIYQITIIDIDGNTDIPNQGIMNITKNINVNILSE